VSELVSAIVDDPGRRELADQLSSGWSAVLKPLAWQGVLCQGPQRGNRITFARPGHLGPEWGTPPEVDEAAATIVPAYLRAYGPATADAFDRYLTRGTSPKAAVRRRFAVVDDAVVTVDVEGAPASVLAADLDELCATRPSDVVRLLGPFDQYVLGPGTSDELTLDAAHRADVSRAAGWISAVVVHAGRVVGTWEVDGGSLDVRLFAAAGDVPADALAAETVRVAPLTGADASPMVSGMHRAALPGQRAGAAAAPGAGGEPAEGHDRYGMAQRVGPDARVHAPPDEHPPEHAGRVAREADARAAERGQRRHDIGRREHGDDGRRSHG
jgi:hypothetical protein